ncbi:MAG: NAD(+) synthase [Muribaculaceae bacterium]|nr:NAD(+) synthase [Muribaculaceae bacterium]
MNNDFGMLRVASVVPAVTVADVEANKQHIIKAVEEAIDAGAKIIALPEMAICGYTCADLLASELLLRQVEDALLSLLEHFIDSKALIIIGAPLRYGSTLLNCAVALMSGMRMAVVPKTYLPNYKEFYEKRWFGDARTALKLGDTISIGDQEFPIGFDLMFDVSDARVAIEICEDLWVPIPPSSIAAINGANVIVNISASNELAGKNDQLLDLISNHCNHCIAAYVYSSAGFGESTTDLVFAGNAIVAENGHLLAQSERFGTHPRMVVADVDVAALNNERRVNGSFADSKAAHARQVRHIKVETIPADYEKLELLRPLRRWPFVPDAGKKRDQRCEEIVNIQTYGLVRRLAHTGIKHVVIGISGGLDSTLALLIAVRAFDVLGLDRSGIIGITMPGFGTPDRTLTNALALMETLGITVKQISIANAVAAHLADIGHDLSVHDTTYENAQARERTQILMDYANKTNALVIGTGDLSELALGWATYNGDHMSMYNVNGSIPKTLAKHLVEWFATRLDVNNPTQLTIHETLLDVLHTPISPELTPADGEGKIQQKTEDIIGPYELHDFFLYNMLRHGFSPAKILFLACRAFAPNYSEETIRKWLVVFCRRFFSQQFKRSCLPDGPKVGSVSLSPRGDWRMPSDASARMWLDELSQGKL